MINNTWTVILSEDGSEVINTQDVDPAVYNNVGGSGSGITDIRGYDGQALCGNYIVGVVSWCGEEIDGTEDSWGDKKRNWYEGLYIAGSADGPAVIGGNIATFPVHDIRDPEGRFVSESPGQVKWLKIRDLGKAYRLPETAFTFFYGANIVGIEGAVMVNAWRGDHSESWVVKFDSEGYFISQDFYVWDAKYGYLPDEWVLDDPGFKADYAMPGGGGGLVTFDPFKTQAAGGGVQLFLDLEASGEPDDQVYDSIGFRDTLVWSVKNMRLGRQTWTISDGPTPTPYTALDLYFSGGSEDADGRVVVISWDPTRPASSPNGPPVFIAVWGDSDYIPEFIDFSLTGELLGGDARFDTGGTP